METAGRKKSLDDALYQEPAWWIGETQMSDFLTSTSNVSVQTFWTNNAMYLGRLSGENTVLVEHAHIAVRPLLRNVIVTSGPTSKFCMVEL